MFRGRRVRALQRKVDLLEKYKTAANAEAGSLRRALAKAERELKVAQQERAEWFNRAQRLSDDRIADAKRLTQIRLAEAGKVIETSNWSSLAVDQAERLGRAVRACVRYRSEIAGLRAENASLVADVRRANDRADLFGGDRAVLPAIPTPETVNLKRENRQLAALAKHQEDQLAAYRRQDEARDRMAQQAVAA